MALVGVKHEPVGLDLNKVCFDEERDIPNTREKSRKSRRVTEWCRCGKCGVMDTNVECLSCGEVETLGSFQLSDMMIRMRSPKELIQQSCNFT